MISIKKYISYYMGFKELVKDEIYGIDNILSVMHALISRFSRKYTIKCYKTI